jgi:hypothetical protein
MGPLGRRDFLLAVGSVLVGASRVHAHLEAAQARGRTLPPAILLRADRVID